MVGKEMQSEPKTKAVRTFGTFEHAPNKVDADEAEEINDEANGEPDCRPMDKKEPRTSEFTPGLEIRKVEKPIAKAANAVA